MLQFDFSMNRIPLVNQNAEQLNNFFRKLLQWSSKSTKFPFSVFKSKNICVRVDMESRMRSYTGFIAIFFFHNFEMKNCLKPVIRLHAALLHYKS